MTADQSKPSSRELSLEKAKEVLTSDQQDILKVYIERGGYQLSPDTAASFFELYLNGSEPEEIQKLNKSFALGAVLWSMVKYDWPAKRDEYMIALQSNVKDKVIKAQLETTNLLTDMLSAANRHHGEKIKKYIQTGDASDLKGALNIDSIGNLLKIVDGLQKITGQSNTHKVKTESSQTFNLNVKSEGANDIDADTAAKLLAVVAESKRKKE